MVYEIVWSDVIKRNLRQVLNYLRDNANEKVAQKYITDLEKRVSVLTTHTESGMPSQKNPMSEAFCLEGVTGFSIP